MCSSDLLQARFELVKGANLTFPRFTTPGPVSRHLDLKGYEVTTGIGPDLMEGARAAVTGTTSTWPPIIAASDAEPALKITLRNAFTSTPSTRNGAATD